MPLLDMALVLVLFLSRTEIDRVAAPAMTVYHAYVATAPAPAKSAFPP